MVEIPSPPPQYPPDPTFYELEKGKHIVRIFDPSSHGTQALTFRFFGPLSRFDHHRGTGKSFTPQDDPERGVYYAAFTLSSCLVEIFGDTRVIETEGKQVASVEIIQPLLLLDLRGSGAMKAGSVSALAKVSDRHLSQAWSRFFYERTDLYGTIDGIIFFNAHNDEEAIALYERARDKLRCPDSQVMALSDRALRPAIQQAAKDNHLIFKG
ncbi:MAG: RES family NAD+ phosphorylase [Snowella sp.]|nr:RES family NAD+ phosphorylase [Snowella sp.]